MNKCIHPSFELPLRICDGPRPGNFHSIPLSLSISQARQWTNEAKANSCIIYSLAPAETAHKGYLANSYWIKVIIEKNLQTNSGDSVEKREPCYTFAITFTHHEKLTQRKRYPIPLREEETHHWPKISRRDVEWVTFKCCNDLILFPRSLLFLFFLIKKIFFGFTIWLVGS